MTPGESTAPWVLLLEQKSYLSSIKKVTQKLLQTTDPYTTILKHRLQKRLVTIISEKQSAAIKKIEQFHILFLLFVT